MAIPCDDQVGHRPEWVVIDLDWCRANSVDLGWATPGAHTVACGVCQVAWRSRAQYVRSLPQRLNWRAARVAELCEAHPLLTELTYLTERGSFVASSSGYFLGSVAHQLIERASLSPRQIEVVERIFRDRIERINRETAWLVDLGVSPDGVMVGEVAEAWHDSSANGFIPRMLLRGATVAEVQSTVPRALFLQLDDIGQLVGRRIELHATFTWSDDRRNFGFARYPRKATKFADETS